jgi:hypothetical protein
MRLPSLRSGYDAVERQIAPRVESLVRTSQAAQARAWILQARAALGDRLDSASARLLHTANLPAGTDIKRLRRQVGALDREVRQLRLELTRHADEGKEEHDDADTARPTKRPGPSSS